MQREEVISVIAAELGVFSWEADGNGNYGVVLGDGSQIRLLANSGKNLLLEGQLVKEASTAFAKLDKCMDLLRLNFDRAIAEPEVLVYVPEYDELALSMNIPFESATEDSIGEVVENFVANVKHNRMALKGLIDPTPGALPSNPHSRGLAK
ncbi:MAG: CesT family type III secretion system chaperone [Puniceicoccales bacterium]|jgi:hypothetical protein|nr:CesT family type III secretion system chaperone [Puniceicoccales bacterium]